MATTSPTCESLGGDRRLAVPRQAVDLGLQVVGQAFADNGSVIPHAKKEGAALGVGEGYDVLVNRGV